VWFLVGVSLVVESCHAQITGSATGKSAADLAHESGSRRREELGVESARIEDGVQFFHLSHFFSVPFFRQSRFLESLCLVVCGDANGAQSQSL
jgi:hypothetical protein